MSRDVIESAPRWIPGWLIGPTLLLLAGLLLLLRDRPELPIEDALQLHSGSLAPRQRVRISHDPPVQLISGYQRTCSDCHALFQSQVDPPPRPAQHAAIKMSHGPLLACGTCHHKENRDLLWNLAREAIGYADSSKLCGDCHQANHGEWSRGVHGRSTGSWDPASPGRGRLECVECHDPHHPRSGAMSPIVPLPGPRTFRMGNPPGPDDISPHHHNPLALDLMRAQESHVPAAASRPAGGEHK